MAFSTSYVPCLNMQKSPLYRVILCARNKSKKMAHCKYDNEMAISYLYNCIFLLNPFFVALLSGKMVTKGA